MAKRFYSPQEVAQLLDVSPTTVMSRIHRGRKALQKALHQFAEARGLVGTSPGPAE